jgi:hypothetical protein
LRTVEVFRSSAPDQLAVWGNAKNVQRRNHQKRYITNGSPCMYRAAHTTI